MQYDNKTSKTNLSNEKLFYQALHNSLLTARVCFSNDIKISIASFSFPSLNTKKHHSSIVLAAGVTVSG